MSRIDMIHSHPYIIYVLWFYFYVLLLSTYIDDNREDILYAVVVKLVEEYFCYVRTL